jgi:hypothetical protein
VIAGLTQVGHLHPAGNSTVRGALLLKTSQAGFGLLGGPPARSAGPAPTAAAHTYHGGRRLGWEPLGRSADPAGLPQGAPAAPVNLPAGQASGGPTAAPGTAGASPLASPESPTILWTRLHVCGPRIASTTPRPNGSYFRPTAHSLNPTAPDPTAARFRWFNEI